MPKTVIIEKSTVINAPIDQVWTISADEFQNIDRWDGNVKSSSVTGTAQGQAPVGGRVCAMYNGRETVESLVEYDAAQRSFTYEITKGLPGFVVSARNVWSHETLAGDRTRLTMRVVMQVKGIIGTVMSGPMKSQMGKVLENAQEELKHFVETGKPHSRKARQISKHGPSA